MSFTKRVKTDFILAENEEFIMEIMYFNACPSVVFYLKTLT